MGDSQGFHSFSCSAEKAKGIETSRVITDNFRYLFIRHQFNARGLPTATPLKSRGRGLSRQLPTPPSKGEATEGVSRTLTQP